MFLFKRCERILATTADTSEAMGGQVILKTGEIETNDNVSEMEVNDFVLYDGTLYRVDNVVHGDKNE